MPDALAPALPAPAVPVRWRALALPAEHGGWGLLGEPIAVGLAIAPSWPGVGVALFAAFAFLARHPLKLAAADWRLGRRTSRTAACERFALLYATGASLGLALAATGASGFWWPLAAALPLTAFQLAHDARNRGRNLAPELAGALALASVAAAELRAGGTAHLAAAVAWLLLATKAAGAVLYVRARLRCDRGVPFDRSGVLGAHAALLGLCALLAARGLAPWLVTAGAAGLLARALHGLSPTHRRVRPQVVGFTEMGYGIGFAVALAVGHAFGW
ncbi:MAG: YwiC-like family protein [Vicinamibacteria bacterium]